MHALLCILCALRSTFQMFSKVSYIVMTSSLAQSPTTIPVLSVVEECVKLYSDSLTTRQHCGLRLRKGSLWRVGSACSGTDSVIRVLEHLGRFQRLGFHAHVQLRK